MQSVAVIVLLVVFCIACPPDDPQCEPYSCNPALPQCQNAKIAWRQKEKEANAQRQKKEKEAKILHLKSQEAIPKPGLDNPRADMHYKKLQGMVKKYYLGTLRIDAMWYVEKEVHDLVKLSNLTIPFPFVLLRDIQTGELRIKVDEYLIVTKHKDYTGSLEDHWRNGTTEHFQGSEWPYLYSLWSTVDSAGKSYTKLLEDLADVEIISLQIVGKTFAPSVAPTKTPTTTKTPTVRVITSRPTINRADAHPRCRVNIGSKHPQCLYGREPDRHNHLVVPTVTTDIPVVSSANFLVVGVASVMPFFLTFF